MFEYYEGWYKDRHKQTREELQGDGRPAPTEWIDSIIDVLNTHCAACPLNAIALEVHREGLQ